MSNAIKAVLVARCHLSPTDENWAELVAVILQARRLSELIEYIQHSLYLDENGLPDEDKEWGSAVDFMETVELLISKTPFGPADTGKEGNLRWPWYKKGD